MNKKIYRGIVQLVEYRSPKPQVVGSNPTAPVNEIKTEWFTLRFYFIKLYTKNFIKTSIFITINKKKESITFQAALLFSRKNIQHNHCRSANPLFPADKLAKFLLIAKTAKRKALLFRFNKCYGQLKTCF